MKLFPIRINNHIDYMVDFEFRANYEESFVVPSDQNGTLIEFFKFTPNGDSKPRGYADKKNKNNEQPDNQYTIQLDKGEKGVYITGFNTASAESEASGLKSLIITISDTDDKQQSVIPDKLSDILSYKDGKISFNRRTDLLILKISLKYGNEVSKPFILYLVPQNKICDVVLDCGSEATQMAIFPSKAQGGLDNLVPIQDDVFQHFGVKVDEYVNDLPEDASAEDKTLNNKKNPENYIQSEPGDICLYKSIFYAKNSFSSDETEDDKIFPTSDDHKNENPILKMCVYNGDLEKMKSSYVQLYNMKISGYGGVESPKVRFDGYMDPLGSHEGFFTRKYISQFVYHSMNRFVLACKKNKNNGNVQPEILRLNVLVPNIYSYERTYKFISTIHEDARAMIDKKIKNEFAVIKGICVNAVSESDASLMGAISLSNDNKVFADGRYLVLDAGKGTMDFSLTEYKGGEYKNIMKSGFIGASASISYGFLLDLLSAYINSNDINVKDPETERDIKEEVIKTYIYNNILGGKTGNEKNGGDLADLCKLMTAVDEYKIKFEKKDTGKIQREEQPVKKLEDLHLDTFVEWIQKCTKQVSTDNVDAIIEIIINSVYQKLLLYMNDANKPEYVIFAGRGFKYEPLKARMFGMLQKLNNNLKEKKFEKAGTAASFKNICMFIKTPAVKGICDNKIIPTPKDLSKEDLDENSKHKHTDKKEEGKKGLKGFVSLTHDDNGNSGSKNTDPSPENDYNYFKTGYKINMGNKVYTIIGGTIYQYQQKIDDEDKKGALFYSNGILYVRGESTKTVYHLTESVNLEKGLSFPSLFPYCTVSDKDKVFLPEIKKEQDEPENSSSENDAGKGSEKEDAQTNAEMKVEPKEKKETGIGESAKDKLDKYTAVSEKEEEIKAETQRPIKESILDKLRKLKGE